MKWRVVGLEAHDAYFNMAIDETLLERVREKKITSYDKILQLVSECGFRRQVPINGGGS